MFHRLSGRVWHTTINFFLLLLFLIRITSKYLILRHFDYRYKRFNGPRHPAMYIKRGQFLNVKNFKKFIYSEKSLKNLKKISQSYLTFKNSWEIFRKNFPFDLKIKILFDCQTLFFFVFWIQKSSCRFHICGATLITMKYAITALHCFHTDGYRKSLSDIQVVAGRYKNRDELFPKYCHFPKPGNEQVSTK